MKRVFSAILALIIVLSLVPAGKVQAAETDVYILVEQQIKAYAASINQNDAAKTAATALLTNAAFRGKDLSYDESSAMTAMIFNSYMFQDALIHSCTEMVYMMQQLNKDSLACGGSLHWYPEMSTYYLFSYTKQGGDHRDMLNTVVTTRWYYENDAALVDKYNSNDKMLVSVAGMMNVEFTITVDEIKENSVVYDIDLKIWDDFDFDGDYGDSGNYTEYEELLTMFGSLTLKSFSWESNVSFQLEAPYACNHSKGSYRWVQDADSHEMVCDTSENYISDPAQRMIYTTTNKDGTTRDLYYYQLQDPVVLRHDKPWVVTYDMKGAPFLALLPSIDLGSQYPAIIQDLGYYTWISCFERDYLTEAEMEAYGAKNADISYKHCIGPALDGKYQQYGKHIYSYTLENVIAEDGSNMVYLTIYDRDLDQIVFGPEPMDDHRVVHAYADELTLVSEEDDWLSGQDIVINYIGNRSYSVNDNVLSVEIYENGIDGEAEDTFEETVVAPTCSSQSYTVHTCTKCGYSYRSDYVDTLPHSYEDTVIAPTCTTEGYTAHICTDCGYSYNTDTVEKLPHTLGEYVSNNDATCTADGTKTAQCTVCGEAVTAPDEGTMLPHSWADATCEEPQTCTVCAATQGDPLGHDLKFYNAKAPTCTKVGWDAYEKCQRCSHSTFARKPALGHTYETEVTVGSCTADGYTTYTCTTCGDTYTDDLIEAPGHNYEDGICTNCGQPEAGLGDVNQDGTINMFDAAKIVSHYTGKSLLTEKEQPLADLNNDGKIDMFDAAKIVALYTGK